jgi:hypothetical protein
MPMLGVFALAASLLMLEKMLPADGVRSRPRAGR